MVCGYSTQLSFGHITDPNGQTTCKAYQSRCHITSHNQQSNWHGGLADYSLALVGWPEWRMRGWERGIVTGGDLVSLLVTEERNYWPKLLLSTPFDNEPIHFTIRILNLIAAHKAYTDKSSCAFSPWSELPWSNDGFREVKDWPMLFLRKDVRLR